VAGEVPAPAPAVRRQVQLPVLRQVLVLELVLLLAPALRVHQWVPLLRLPAIAPLRLPVAPAALPVLVPGAVARLVVQLRAVPAQLPQLPTLQPLQAMPTSRSGAKQT
jgi:hypothetical protein